MGAVVRFYAAVKDGLIVGARSTVKKYTHAVLHTNVNGTFATFHTTAEGAHNALRAFASHPTKRPTRVYETRRRLAVGEVFDLADVLGSSADEDLEYHQRRSPAYLVVRGGVAS